MAPAATSPVTPSVRPTKDPRPAPPIPDIDCGRYTSEDDLVHDVIEGIRSAGFCIVRQVIKLDALEKIGQELHPYLSSAAVTPGQFWPRETRKLSSMLSKSHTYALELVGNPVYQRVGEYFLTSELKDYWVSCFLFTILYPSVDFRHGMVV